MEPQDHYAALIQSSDDAIIAKDLEGRIVTWNPAAERLFGWTRSEIVGQSVRRIIPEELFAEEDRILARVRAGEKIGLFIADRLHKSGERISVAMTISPVHGADGQIVGASNIGRDASDRLMVEQKLRESENRFRMMADNIAQLAWIAEANGDIFWYNEQWYRYTGTDLATMQGWGWRVVQHPDHLERVERKYRTHLAMGEEWEDLFPLKSASGDWRWFLSRAKPIRDENGEIVYWFGTNTDITEQREQSEQILTLLREVNHRSKNMLAKVQALARSSIDGDRALVKRFEARVGSLAVNQDILVRRDWGEVPVGELAHLQLEFLGDAVERIHVSGPECALLPRATEIIGMALHELATNSLDHGALSAEEGEIDVRWECRGEEFAISWRESGGPAVAPPARRGFGSQLIEDIPRSALGADVTYEFRSEGIVWSLRGANGLLADPVRHAAI